MKASKFTLGAIALVVLSASGWASDKRKANIHIFDTVQLGSTQLAPGEYRMTWTENGPNTEVTFSQDKKVTAAAPAQISRQPSGYDFPALHIDGASDALIGVALPKVLLSFAPVNTVRSKSAN